MVRQIKRAKDIPRESTLRSIPRAKSNHIPFVTKYNRTLPSIGEILHRHWNLLQLNPNIKVSFTEPLVLAYKRCPNLRDFLGSNTVENNRVKRKQKQSKEGQSKLCLTRDGNLYCTQIVNTSTFKNNVTNRTYNIYHNLTCKSRYIIYVMECVLCNLQYVGKSEWPMDIRLNNHRNDVRREDAIPAIKHFSQSDYHFNSHAKFIPIEQIKNLNKSKEEIRRVLEDREDFWILKLKTLQAHGLNDRLKHPYNVCGLVF